MYPLNHRSLLGYPLRHHKFTPFFFASSTVAPSSSFSFMFITKVTIFFLQRTRHTDQFKLKLSIRQDITYPFSIAFSISGVHHVHPSIRYHLQTVSNGRQKQAYTLHFQSVSHVMIKTIASIKSTMPKIVHTSVKIGVFLLVFITKVNHDKKQNVYNTS